MIKRIKAVSMDERFSQFAKEGLGKVHSKYNRVINIIFNNEIYAISAKSVPCGANTAVTDIDNFSIFTEKIGTTVICKDGKITIGSSLLIDCTGAKLFDCKCPNLSPYSKDSLKNGLLQIEREVCDKTLFIGCMSFVREQFLKNEYEEKDSVQRFINNRLKMLINSYPNCEEMVKNSTKLIGLGLGLTPSGDDFLCGFFLGLYATKDTCYAQYANSMLNILPNVSTTDVSYQMLNSAFFGKTTGAHIKLIESIFNSGKGIEYALNTMVNIGHSSGMDFTAGFISACHCILNNK